MNTNTNGTVGLPELHTQMRITNRLLVAQLGDKMQQNDLIRLLSTSGASYKEIADMLDTSPAVVGVTIHRQKKKKK